MRAYHLFLFFLMFSVSSYAEEEIIKEEASSHKTTVQEIHLEADLIDSAQYKECREQIQRDPNESIEVFSQRINKCFNEKFDDENIKELAEKTNLVTIAPEQSKTAKGIREYLSEKIDRAIQGKDYDPSTRLKKRKYVDQLDYFRLYAEQLGKNVILETTNYCLENLRFTESSYGDDHDEYKFLMPPRECIGDGLGGYKVTLDKNCLEKLQEINFPYTPPVAQWVATVDELKKASKAEIQSPHLEEGYFAAKSNFCGQVIKAMCDGYKCRKNESLEECTDSNGMNTFAKDQPGKNDPSGLFPVEKVTRTNGHTAEEGANGSIACTVINKLRSYRQTLAQVEKIIKETEDHNKGRAGGYNLDIAFDPSTDINFSEITTVSSREITDNEKITSFLSEEEKKELEKCKTLSAEEFQKDKKCSALIDFGLEDKEESLTASMNAEILIRQKEVEALKNKGQDDIKKYLEKLGFQNHYKENMTNDELQSVIDNHYKTEKETLIEKMRNQLKERVVKKEATDDKIQEAAGIAITDLENEKDRLGTILHYNNVISSFLTTEDESTKERSTNIVSLQREMEDYDKFKNKDDDQTASEYFKNAYDGRENTNNKASGLNYMDYLDQLIGNSK